MFKTIIWATDGSQLADAALPLVQELATAHGSTIVAVHADELLRGRAGGAPVLADEDDLRRKIERQVGELREIGFAAELKVAIGSTLSAADLVAATAREVEADLIVLATHGRGTVSSLFLGSVARRLLHEAPCPVLVVPPPIRASAVALTETAAV
jgi:nucleotide-binding universal stress UspA family protein